jgi:uncharacterized protein
MEGKSMDLHKVSFILLIIGGLNWLVFGLFGFDVGSLIGGMTTVLARLIYVVVGLAALYEVATHKTNCRNCSASEVKKPVV